MRINPVGINYSSRISTNKGRKLSQSSYAGDTVSFQKGNACKKALGMTFGTSALLGSVLGTIIMTGGVILPAVAIYTGIATAAGVAIGHEIDKADDKDDKKKKGGV